MASDEGGVWRTVGGRRIFIKDGEDLSTAMKNSGKFKSKKDDTSKKDEHEEEKHAEIPEKEIRKITTQKSLKALVEDGRATDITGLDNEETKALGEKHGRLEQIKVLKGVYGMNGALLRSRINGEYFVITARNTNLFYWV